MKRFSKIRSKRRYSQRRRRFRKRGRMMSRVPRAVFDGVYRAICTLDVDIAWNTGAGVTTVADIFIDWGTQPIYTATNAHPYYCFANTPEHQNFGIAFREYRLKGIKVSYKIPQQTAYAGNPTSYFQYTELVRATMINQGVTVPTNGSSPTDATLIAARDYKTYTPRPLIKSYTKVGKYWKKINGQQWLATNQSGTSPQAYNASASGNLVYSVYRLYMNTSGAPMVTVSTARIDFYIEYRIPAV